jgi:hypothetical protein
MAWAGTALYFCLYITEKARQHFLTSFHCAAQANTFVIKRW